MKYVLKYRMILLGALVGAGLGYLYWMFVGCSSGTCLITSSPVNSSIYGAFMGGILFEGFNKAE